MELKTPLYDVHVESGGKIVEFGGFLLPVQYATGVNKEHMAVRTAAGMFDVSHMGEIVFKGETALDSLNHIMTNDFTNMTEGRVRYTTMLNENGGVVDDLVVCKFGDIYLAVVNASNTDKDFAHIQKYVLPGTTVENISEGIAQIALQGPKAPEILAKVCPDDMIPKKYYTAVNEAVIDGMKCMVSRTGYTGELGYEIYTEKENAEKLWKTLLAAGEEFGCIPCGLGARDTLRMEAAMPLYGHEMNDEISPLETGLNFGVKMEKEEFVGKKALEEKGEPTIARVGLEVTGKGIIREHMDVYLGDEKIGHTTSGTKCPYINKAIGMALVDAAHTEVGTALEVDVRGRRVAVEIVPLPFYKRGK